jgi:alpha,alpha-trehalase
MTVWSLIYEEFDPDQEKLREALCTLGNGYFATRGASPESAADDIHYPGTYLAGGYNRLKTEIKDKVIENEDLVNLPNWLCLSFRHPDGEWFNLSNVEILAYRQELDMKRGILLRSVHFKDREGRCSLLKERRLVHMAEPHLAALEITLTPENWSGELMFRSALDGSVVNGGVPRYKELNSRHLEPLEARALDQEILFLKVQTTQSELRIALAARTRVCKNGDVVDIEKEPLEQPGYVAHHFTVQAEQGVALGVEKTVTLFTSRDHASAEAGLEAVKCLNRADSFDGLIKTHALAWKQLWQRFDMAYEEQSSPDERSAMILHLYTFHLLQSTSMHTMDLDVGVPSRGWHGEAYRGHIFWDELFIFPFLNLRIPEITRSLLMYRYRRINEARAAAKAEGYGGAMYPWQSGSNGREETQKIHLNPKSGRWIPDGSRHQRHVNAAIAYNICQYYQATHDMEFLSFYGAEMMLEIARFWASMSTYNPDLDRYEIHGVMGPDEYHEAYPDSDQPGISNNAYTNIMAVWVLTESLKILDILPQDRKDELRDTLALDSQELERWQDISHKMRVVFHDDGIISQFEGYENLEELDWEAYREKYDDIQRLDRILEAEDDTPNGYKASKQADVLMLFYLFSSEELRDIFDRLGYPFEYETIPKNIDYYMRRTSHGSTLSRVVHSWVLVRKDRPRSWHLFTQALESDISDIQGGTTPEGIHLGAMAGCINMIQRGYTGIETRGDVLWFNPCLPEQLKHLEMQIRYRGQSLHIAIDADKFTITACRCNEASIQVGFKEKVFALEENESREIPL